MSTAQRMAPTSLDIDTPLTSLKDLRNAQSRRSKKPFLGGEVEVATAASSGGAELAKCSGQAGSESACALFGVASEEAILYSLATRCCGHCSELGAHRPRGSPS